MPGAPVVIRHAVGGGHDGLLGRSLPLRSGDRPIPRRLQKRARPSWTPSRRGSTTWAAIWGPYARSRAHQSVRTVIIASATAIKTGPSLVGRENRGRASHWCEPQMLFQFSRRLVRMDGVGYGLAAFLGRALVALLWMKGMGRWKDQVVVLIPRCLRSRDRTGIKSGMPPLSRRTSPLM